MDETFKYTSFDVALFMMNKAAEYKIIMNHTKVHKFMFILYSMYLISQGKRLTDESPKAWPYGPVFPTVKRKLERFNVNVECFNIEDYRRFIGDASIFKDENLSNICDEIFKSKFAKMTTNQLVEWTHIPGAPWDETTKKKGFKWNDPISDKLIISYYGRPRN